MWDIYIYIDMPQHLASSSLVHSLTQVNDFSPSLTSLISFLEVSVVETWKFAFSIIYILEDVSYFGVLQLFSIL
ncbi:hypothetical protein Leryth_021190 [Lithospermum erythrorhizon]|nr:hypothetical protein Leryth_021190 [Lithospermum erythrorhizon]